MIRALRHLSLCQSPAFSLNDGASSWSTEFRFHGFWLTFDPHATLFDNQGAFGYSLAFSTDACASSDFVDL